MMRVGLPIFFPMIRGVVRGSACLIGLVSLKRAFDSEASAILFFRHLEGFESVARIPPTQ